jgi:hypothetical protein
MRGQQGLQRGQGGQDKLLTRGPGSLENLRHLVGALGLLLLFCPPAWLLADGDGADAVVGCLASRGVWQQVGIRPLHYRTMDTYQGVLCGCLPDLGFAVAIVRQQG